jgi:hypothetical protein
MTTQDSLDHISKVSERMVQVIDDLTRRAAVHDDSKLMEPELSGYDRLHEELTPIAYGTPEYRSKMAEFRWLLDHHFAANDHHPEHFRNGVAGMTLMSLVEMLADWKAASERPTSRSAFSLDWNVDRFWIEPQLASILRNTALELGWLRAGEATKRYWVSWEQDAFDDETGESAYDVVINAIDCWESGWSGDGERVMICAVIDAESERAVWEGVGKMVGEYTERFCTEQPSGWQPGGRFPGKAKRTVIRL